MPGWIQVSCDETCHVVWRVEVRRRETFLHAIGDGAVGNKVTEEMARKRFENGRCISPRLPVLFPGRAVTVGRRHINCVTAASRALVRGWLYWG
jgi:hypothetical protein